MSASQSLVSNPSVSTVASSSSLSYSNIADSSVSKSDLQDSNVENLQKNNYDAEHIHSSSHDSNADSDHDNQVESKKTTGMGNILQI